MFNEGDWSAFLSRELGGSVRVRFGKARQRVLEAQYRSRANFGSRVFDVRMSAFFAEAPPEIREAVARWLRVGRRARKSAALLDSWIERAVALLPPPPRRTCSVRTSGAAHDLSPLVLELLNSPTFLPPLESAPAVTWGRRTGVRARRSLQLGCYVSTDHLIRVHPVLDQAWVPAWFVSYILLHELLHAALPSEHDSNGRAVHHGREFKRWERRYPDYARAITWLDNHLPSLLRSARSSARSRSRGASKGSRRPVPELVPATDGFGDGFGGEPVAADSAGVSSLQGWLFPLFKP